MFSILSTLKFYFGLLILSLIVVANTYSQTPPPKAGTYICANFSTVGTTTIELNTSIVTKETKQKIGSGTMVNVTRAPFDIVLKSNGTYSLINIPDAKGTYRFDPQTKKVVFTGDLTLLNFESYMSDGKIYTLEFTSKSGLIWRCELGGQANSKATQPASSEKLNSGLAGTITFTVSNEQNYFSGKIYEFSLSKGTSRVVFDNGVANRSPSGEFIYVDQMSQISLHDKTGKMVRQLSNPTDGPHAELYPAMSLDGNYLAFTVNSYPKTNSASDFVLRDGYKVIITDRKLQQVAEFKGYTQAAWMPDGSIVVAGSRDVFDINGKQGLFIIDKTFKNVKRLAEGYTSVKMPAVRPDGKQIAFVNNDEIWVLDLTTNLTKKVIHGTETAFPTWSPDGNYLILNAIDPDSKRWLVYVNNIAADAGFWLKDAQGNYIEGQNRITWLP